MRANAEALEHENDFFEMANLPPDFTGLPMVVWVSERGHSRHDVLVKVSLTNGRRASPDRMTSVSVRPTVEVVAGEALPAADLGLVRKWVELNRDTIIGYWNGTLFTNEMIAKIRSI